MKWTRLIPVLFVLSLTSCALPGDAEKMTADTISPEYSTYVEADSSLSDAAKAARQINVDSWRDRVGLPALPVRPSQERIRGLMQPQPAPNGGN
ncbi:MAG: hypothetical protein E6R03_09075 [Hyphomicrobiaceae bacterium]|nr:MAG: hypothetical protein E6R03_09075 [Hyphomicrobiaceae bacterium]